MAVDPQETKVPVVLTIAGSDSGSGAGIQADLKTFAAHGVHGTSAITAVTAQNTLGVTAVQEVDLDVIAAQIDAVVEDMHPVAVKTGMLSSPEIVRLVAAKANEYGWQTLVVDPVMVASSGARLLRDEAVETYRTELLPLAAVTTPNLLEATELTGIEIASSGDVREAAKAISVLGVKYVVVKGGHMEVAGESRDLLYDGSDFVEFGLPWIDTTSTHGTGCTFAAAVTAQLALGRPLEEAVPLAQQYVAGGIRSAPDLGRGHGPMDHFWKTLDPRSSGAR